MTDSEGLVAAAIEALQAGRPDAALPLAQRAADADAASPLAQNVLGVVLRHNGRLADAIERLRHAVRLDPDFRDAQINLGNALLDAGEPQSALPHYQKALALDPASASAHNNLGNLYRELRRPSEAIASYRQALKLDPQHARAHANLANLLKDLGDTDAAIAEFRHSLRLSPNRPEVWSNLLLTLNCSDHLAPSFIADEHRAFGRHFARLLPPLPPGGGERSELRGATFRAAGPPQGANHAPSGGGERSELRGATFRAAGPPQGANHAPSGGGERSELRGPQERLRVGYVSADFRKHAVATFFEPLLQAHDRLRFEVFCYYNQPRGDEVTDRIRAGAEHFLPIAGMTDAQLAERIRRDGIDVLVDLNGHSADNRLPLFFLRPAPVQATWLGYLGSTGVPTIDWRITDRHVDPEGAEAIGGLERPWRLAETIWCYQPYTEAPAVNQLPAQTNGYVTFASLNNPGKVSAATLAMWRDILGKLDDARLILLTSPDASRVRQLTRYFEERGIERSRVEFVERVPLRDYLALYSRADIALDTFPYTGGTTTCDALWMGVPVITCATQRPFGRSGASILANVGLTELVTGTSEHYVAAAIRLAMDRQTLAGLRSELRMRMRASPLTDARRFARAVETALEAMCGTR